MIGDIVVQMAGGTYLQSTSWTFTAVDSGANGYNVIWQAAPGQHVVVSGGQSITGWTLHDASKNIYQASVPTGFNTRQIYVNGTTANVAQSDAPTVFGTMTKTSTGFTYAAAGPNSWTDGNSVVLVYGAPAHTLHFKYSLCPASAVSSGAVTVQAACYGFGQTDGFSVPTLVENAYAVLNTPGQFTVDTTTNTMYYIPSTGQDMSTATVIAGGIQSLLTLTGTSSTPVHNIEFSGVAFEYSGWVLNADGEVDVQANTIYSTANGSETIPDAVQCHACQSVSFTGNTFQHLGGGGIGLDGGGTSNSVTGNVFTDIASNGIDVGNAVAPVTVESDDTVSDNYVFNVDNEYLGGAGITASYVAHSSFDHNEVWGTPYTGISIGWGWGLTPPSGMVDNHVDYNFVHDVMTAGLSDGGAIYLNGDVASSPSSTVVGNHVSQSGRSLAALYLDNGSAYWQVNNNVVDGYAAAWLYIQQYSPTADHNTVQTNYVASTAGAVHGTPPSDNTVSGNSTGLTSWKLFPGLA